MPRHGPWRQNNPQPEPSGRTAAVIGPNADHFRFEIAVCRFRIEHLVSMLIPLGPIDASCNGVRRCPEGPGRAFKTHRQAEIKLSSPPHRAAGFLCRGLSAVRLEAAFDPGEG